MALTKRTPLFLAQLSKFSLVDALFLGEVAGVPGVASVHDLHVWSITSGKASLTAHVVQREDVTNPQALLLEIRQLVASKYDIHHSTIQIETTPCEQAAEEHSFGPAPAHDHASHGGHDEHEEEQR
jgi:cobalt-zinc-cadmium efflux system protein